MGSDDLKGPLQHGGIWDTGGRGCEGWWWCCRSINRRRKWDTSRRWGKKHKQVLSGRSIRNDRHSPVETPANLTYGKTQLSATWESYFTKHWSAKSSGGSGTDLFFYSHEHSPPASQITPSDSAEESHNYRTRYRRKKHCVDTTAKSMTAVEELVAKARREAVLQGLVSPGPLGESSLSDVLHILARRPFGHHNISISPSVTLDFVCTLVLLH